MSRRFLIVLVIVIVGFLIWNWLNQREYVMYALDVNTGAILWSAGLPESQLSTSEPFVADGVVYVGLVTQKEDYPRDPLISLVAIDAATGVRRWAYVPDPQQFPDTPDWMWSDATPYASAGLVFMQLPQGQSDNTYQLLAIDAQSGSLRWTLPKVMFLNAPRMYPEVRAIGDRLFALAYDGKDIVVQIIDPATGKVTGELWRRAADSEESFDNFDAPFLQTNSNTLFLITSKGVRAFDPQAGTEKYLIEGNSLRYWALEKTLIVRSLSDVAAYDAATGERLWQYQPEDQRRLRGYFKAMRADEKTITVMCDCRSDDGDSDSTLYVLDTQTGQELWSQYISGGISDYFLRGVPVNDAVLTALSHYDNDIEISGIAAFDAKIGALRWQFVTAPTRLKSPATDGDRVYVTAWDSRLREWLSRSDPSWRFRLGLSEN